MGKKAFTKFLIYLFYAVSLIITLILLLSPEWDNQSETTHVGVLLSKEEGNLHFGFMNNEKSNESSLYQILVYAVVYLCIIALVNLALIGFTSLESSRVAKWLHTTLCIAHCSGEVFIFFIATLRYISSWTAPLSNFFVCIFGILVNLILILLLIIYKKPKKAPVPISEIKVEEGKQEEPEVIEVTKLPTTQSTVKNNNDPQLISEGIATPLYYGNNEIVEHQPTVKPVIDQSKIVISDNIVGTETYLGENQFQYNNNQPIEVNMESYNNNANNDVENYGSNINANNMDNCNNNNMNTQYNYNESNAYPVASNTVYQTLPELPKIENMK